LIKSQEAQTNIHPNSLASVLMMDGKEAPKHYVKNVMPTPFKWFGVIVALFVVLVFLTFGILAIYGSTL